MRSRCSHPPQWPVSELFVLHYFQVRQMDRSRLPRLLHMVAWMSTSSKSYKYTSLGPEHASPQKTLQPEDFRRAGIQIE